DLVIRELSPHDRIRYSLACRETRDYVASFNERAFHVARILRRYFPDASVLSKFRYLQYYLDILISGSTALQFLERTTYNNTDLDLYMNYEAVPQFKRFLETTAGYVWTPRCPHETSAYRNLYEAYATVSPHIPYEARGIVKVFNFLCEGETVQVIATKNGPMDAILGFHSTCVMNVITFSHAYSLFPYTTFHSNANVRISRRFTSAPAILTYKAAIEKYERRGWQSAYIPSSDVYLRLCSEFRTGLRYVGDSSSWTVALEGIAGDVLGTTGLGLEPRLMGREMDPVRCNSWFQKVDGRKFSVFNDNSRPYGFDKNFTFKYTLSLARLAMQDGLFDMNDRYR
ncbi:hypothetical protein K435DRAFT_657263, partial [Dendrothele bispora CBS 962.96]